MYSVIDVGGKQYNVKEGDVIAVDKIDKKEKEKIEFNNIMLIKEKNDNIKIGSPYIDGAKVTASIVSQLRDKKVHVFKFKKRKSYKRLRGHKQHYTMIKIDKIIF